MKTLFETQPPRICGQFAKHSTAELHRKEINKLKTKIEMLERKAPAIVNLLHIFAEERDKFKEENKLLKAKISELEKENKRLEVDYYTNLF
jgi:chromosome segregation ATPase